MSKISALTTETSNENTKKIDTLSSLEICELINSEDAKVALAVQKELPSVAKAIDGIAEKFLNGGRIIYIGAGTSGRMGTLDAVELTPTYNVDPSRAFGIMAGGQKAMYVAVEGAEDSKELALEDLKNINLTENDALIGIAASGRTPYVISALEYGNQVGAFTVSVTCNGNSEMAAIAQVSIAPVVGAEVISGSTRMKSGTAQKMVLNMISTGVMVKSGKVYQNYMVHVQPTNIKLVARSKNMIQTITGVDAETADHLFEVSGGSVAVAILMHEKNVTKEEALAALSKTHDSVRQALELL